MYEVLEVFPTNYVGRIVSWKKGVAQHIFGRLEVWLRGEPQRTGADKILYGAIEPWTEKISSRKKKKKKK
jgi:hypothetical protein